MTPPTPFDVFAVPLDRLTVIEASAGTGKTYAITQLYVRLLVEQGVPVDRALVVTYTKAATQELRTRLRAVLDDVRAALSGEPTREPFAATFAARLPDRALALARVQQALAGFDEAAIFTIHAFCQRVLAESAFESGASFTVELVTDETELREEVVDDFWRQHVVGESPGFVASMLDPQAECHPEQLQEILKRHVGRPDVIVRPAGPPVDVADVQSAFAAACADVRALWPTQRAAVAAAFASPALSRTQYKLDLIPSRLAAMDLWLSSPRLELFAEFPKFTTGGIVGATRVRTESPAVPFFDACTAVEAAATRLRTAYADRRAALKAQLLHVGAAELAARKQARGLQSYDDLLARLAAALDHGERGERLAAAVRERYAAALIDEFQDTDPVQYRIVQRIWGRGGIALVVVGDPKQAIYSFRGADVVTYLAARRAAIAPCTLAVNWRADPGLLTAIESLFRRHPRPFLLDDIQFQPVVAAAKERRHLDTPGDDEPPCRVWWLRDDAGGLLSKRDARRMAAQATAGEIARLMNSGATLGGAPLAGSDLAVLVRTHHEGRMVRDALARHGIPSVQHALDSVFHSPEAVEVERLLAAVVAPGDGARVRAGLATELLGGTAAHLLALVTDEPRWEAEVEAFHGYHDEWRRHGFARMLRAVVADRAVAARLLALADGERRLTNLWHLGELLQAEAARHGDSMDRLLEWLQARRRKEPSEANEQQLRLESDERLVQIVTIHRSKGLEYPIVFCPFLWDGNLRSSTARTITFHDPAADGQATMDLGSPQCEDDREYALREELAERIRLAYVALTRAQHRCYLVAGRVNEVGQSALGWLLHAPSDATTAGPLGAMAKATAARGDAALHADVEAIVATAPGAITVLPLAIDRGELVVPLPAAVSGVLAPRRCLHPVPPHWRMTSFSALTAAHEPERPDYDAVVGPRPLEPARIGRDIADFPRGARAGRCLHAIFERIDFTQRGAAAFAPVVTAALVEHGFPMAWTDPVGEMVERVLTTALDPAGLVRLADVLPAGRLDELEFTHPLVSLDVKRLRTALRAHGYDREPFAGAVDRLEFPTVHGFMKGFIDGVFLCGSQYVLVDYKSNWLGPTVDDYAAERLPAVIARERYFLQYLIYTVVVHRLLRLRLPGYDYDRDVAGVYYLFLRGMDPQRGPTAGVFADKPPRALVERLDQLMATGGAAA